jgi:aryl-alcohol dehydrogenase-like predicted oxidoreductase
LDDVPVWQRRTRHFDSRRTPQCRHGTCGAERETTQALEAIGRIAGRHRLGMAEISLRWAMAGEGIACSLCGTHSIAELEQNLAAARSPLAAEIVAELNAATRGLMDALGPGFDYYERPDNDRTR